MYDSGHGVAKIYAEAVKWYTLAAEHRFAGAQYNFALKCRTGDGVARDNAYAAEWVSGEYEVTQGRIYAIGR